MARLLEILAIELLPVLGGLVGLLLALLIWRRWRRRQPAGARPRRARRQSILNEPGRAFLDALDRAVGGEYRVFVRVPAAEVVQVLGEGNAERRRAEEEGLARQAFDFLLCDPDTLAPLCAIQIDARGRDGGQSGFIGELCREIGLPLLRVPERPAYAVSRLRNLIRERVAAAEVPGVDASREPWIGEATEPVEDPETGTAATPTAGDPRCPRCGSGMTARAVTTGAHAGRRVWRCARYPECPAVVTDARARD